MVYVECKADFTLVESITEIPKKEIIHEGGKSEVCKKLEKKKNCKGLVDEDPWSVQPPYVKKLGMKEDLSSYDLKILHDNSNKNALIVLCPRLEEWELKAAKEVNVDMKQYDLPKEPSKLHAIININLDKFERLIESLKQRSNRLKALKKLLR